MIVGHEEGDRFQVSIRGHRLSIDQPVADGGTDTGPTPTELFVAGLASCIAFYADRYLRRRHLPINGLRVDCAFSFAEDRPRRVASISLRVDAPGFRHRTGTGSSPSSSTAPSTTASGSRPRFGSRWTRPHWRRERQRSELMSGKGRTSCT